MVTREQAVAGGSGGFAVLLGLGVAGVDPFTAVLAGVFAYAGSFDPILGEALSIAGNSISSAKIASDGLSIQPVLEILPTEVLNIISGLILGAAAVSLWIEVTGDGSLRSE